MHSLTTKIVEMGHVCAAFEMHVCGIDSLFPAEKSLVPFCEAHLRRCVAYCSHAFRGGKEPTFILGTDAESGQAAVIGTQVDGEMVPPWMWGTYCWVEYIDSSHSDSFQEGAIPSLPGIEVV